MDVTYSATGNANLVHTLVHDNGTTVLSWVSLDSTNNILTLNTTNVDISTYSLFIETNASRCLYANRYINNSCYYDRNQIIIQVDNCTVEKCINCQSHIGN